MITDEIKFIKTTPENLESENVQENYPNSFIHTHNEYGDDQLYIGEDRLTDKLNVGDSNLNNPTRKVGGLDASTIGDLKERSMSEILLDILRPDVVEPTITTEPKVSISYSGSKLITVNSNLPERNDIDTDVTVGEWSDGTKYSNGYDSINLTMSPNKWGDASTEGTYVISGSAVFQEGGIPKDNFGTPYPDKQYGGGTKNSNTIKIVSVYPIRVNDVEITSMNEYVVDYLSGVVTLYVDIPEEIDGTLDKFKIYLPGVFTTFDVKQFNTASGKYDTDINMTLIDGRTSDYIRTNDVFDTIGPAKYEIKLKK